MSTHSIATAIYTASELPFIIPSFYAVSIWHVENKIIIRWLVTTHKTSDSAELNQDYIRRMLFVYVTRL